MTKRFIFMWGVAVVGSNVATSVLSTTNTWINLDEKYFLFGGGALPLSIISVVLSLRTLPNVFNMKYWFFIAPLGPMSALALANTMEYAIMIILEGNLSHDAFVRPRSSVWFFALLFGILGLTVLWAWYMERRRLRPHRTNGGLP